MAKEIERKFLVKDSSFMDAATRSVRLAQGYLSRDPDRTVRIRLKDEKAYLTVKGRTHGAEREEYEYEIPFADGERMLSLCSGRIVKKTRYYVPFGGKVWEVDRFEGELSPLVVAEIELGCADDDFELPPFVGEEVTDNPAYYNSNL